MPRWNYLTNFDGEVTQHMEYVPYGEVFINEQNNKWNTPYLFNGKELDEETGLYYYGARYYNPRESVWLSVDPLWEKVGPQRSPYEYTFSNPVNFIDPDGKKVVVYDDDGNANTYKYEENRDYSGMSDFVADTYKALDKLYGSSNVELNGKGKGKTNILSELIKSKKELSIVSTDKGSHFAKGESESGLSKQIGTIRFNSSEGVLFDDTNDSGSDVLGRQLESGGLPETAKINSPISVLGHETAHAYSFLTRKKTTTPDGKYSNSYRDKVKDISTRSGTPYFKNAEEKRATGISKQINVNLGENPRNNHRGLGVPVKSVNSKTLR